MRLDTDLPPLSVPGPGSNLLYSEWFSLIKQTQTHRSRTDDQHSKIKGLTDATFFHFISVLHSNTHFFLNSNKKQHSPFTFRGELSVFLSAVHQTYSITLRLRDHNRLSWITRLPYINMQRNISCIKNTKAHICEDLVFLKCFLKITLKQLEIQFPFSILFELLYLQKLAFKIKLAAVQFPYIHNE